MTRMEEWKEEGIAKGATHLLVVCDTFSHEDYPVYVLPNQSLAEFQQRYSQNMQRIDQVVPLPAVHPINTAEGMLRTLLCVNKDGVWFIELEGHFCALPKWMWAHCKRACKNPRVI